MVIGVTMVKVVPGQERTVYNALREIEGIKDVYHVFGEYDFVVVLEVEGLSVLNRLVDTIREIHNVTATQTVVGAEL
ncbi:MAG: Lrp/AsnC ligand binding domain-containing protein [Methanothrix sp.]|mgnify:FL=1|jgi:DNA-binding Lrp family transcriptional regulator|uniref:Transcriptional regulator, AsnC family n=1 Tax=Methanothrix harundinacea TaxID=301375 RepID=A0A101FV41_9EURY|nr:MAG: AsnC family transcriptional regulator [Methanosaeta sp. SDB]KUK45006.1 MAG: Transcriptional regulator, AsnC family [Methanothrix harundinacea]MDD2637893.1 Lrp/AsnC ligand binding domain-containing protein [Methanothrix sp.]MDI9400097.1 Lrp/AsnC ligand binding domain-containing protein [Euryarchaeota archaeon]KUK96694.1 MAG: Transcriptional regulator, AsnC family [Methanothrix harundinacea]